MDKVELIKKRLSNVKRNNEETKSNIEGALLSEKINNLSNKEEAFSILIESAYCIKVINHLCDNAIDEAGKSFFDSNVVLTYINEIEYYCKELDSLIDKYNLIRKKRSLISIFQKNKA
jgi:hypothetical protein